MRTFFTLVIWALGLRMLACDGCGCSINQDQWGVLPNQQMNWFGLRYQYRSFLTQSPENQTIQTHDYFQRADALMRIRLNNRWQLSAIIPYKVNTFHSNLGTQSNSGIGDPLIQGSYMFVEPGCGKVSYALQGSAGIEVPIGQVSISHNEPATAQVGSGSWDGLISLNQSLRFNKIGLLQESSFRKNGHMGNYEWGDAVTASLRLFGSFDKDSVGIVMPWIQLGYEWYESNLENREYGIKAAMTGGYNVLASVGLDYYGSRWGSGIEFSLPMKSALADGTSKMQQLINVRLFYFLSHQKQKK